MSGPRLMCLLLTLATLTAAAPAAAQYASPRPDPGLDELKYRAIHGHPRPSRQESKDGDSSQEAPTAQPSRPPYRFSQDQLLNPPGSGDRGAALRPAGQATPPASPPQREIRVRVVDDQGQPVPLAQVSLSTRRQPFFREGLTDGRGYFTTSVPCYLPGGEDMLSHSLRVSTSWGSTERMLVTRQGNCATAYRVSVILNNPNRLNQMLERYHRRQELYEQDEQGQKDASAQGQAAPGAPK